MEKQKQMLFNGMINGPVSIDLPASALQNHPDDVIVIVDDAAASKLS
jgi:glucosamine-6-phosphate deaminase